MEENQIVLGILVGGGPAPGLNKVIASSTIYAISLGWKVLGFQDGYRHLITGDLKEVQENTLELTYDLVSFNSKLGGSILRSDRFDPTRSYQNMVNIHSIFATLHIRYFLVFGGNQNITGAHILMQGFDPAKIQTIVIPKTIDNDVMLPEGQDTFGHHSAYIFGSKIIKNLMQDSKSAPRWFIVQTMGKRSGHLALNIACATGAHLAIIPEDFRNRRITLEQICDIIEGTVIKRLARGMNFGVCLISEGVIDQMTPSSIQSLIISGCASCNSEGQIILDEVELSRAIVKELKKRFENKFKSSENILPVRFASKKMGYELRSAPPCAFDCQYADDLGYAAIEGFIHHHSNCVVIWQNGTITYKSFRELMDPATGRIIPKRVNVENQNYKIMQEYFWNIKVKDLRQKSLVTKMAEIEKLSLEKFVKRFNKVVELTQSNPK